MFYEELNCEHSKLLMYPICYSDIQLQHGKFYYVHEIKCEHFYYDHIMLCLALSES
jgi:hypothetical protein